MRHSITIIIKLKYKFLESKIVAITQTHNPRYFTNHSFTLLLRNMWDIENFKIHNVNFFGKCGKHKQNVWYHCCCK